ncbi:MAG TPA: universal stress protein [Arenibacter sp.]|nr:universal stress protein [Arenibacter sp.]
MKKILIPTDFSENAYGAMTYAVQLFEGEECTFYLLNSYTPAIYQSEYLLHSPGQIGLGDIYRIDSEDGLKHFRDRIITEYGNPKHRFEVRSAFSVLMEAIDDLVEEEEIDLIIMGTQGATGAKEIFLGSNTVHAIKRAKRPILAIPFRFEYNAPKKILFPTDYEIDYSTDLLKEVFLIADLHQATIDVLHIKNNYDFDNDLEMGKSKLKGLLSDKKHHFHEVPDRGIIEAINEAQIKYTSNFLVMVRNKHSFLENLFSKPVINQIGFHTKIPFLVLPYHLLNKQVDPE